MAKFTYIRSIPERVAAEYFIYEVVDTTGIDIDRLKAEFIAKHEKTHDALEEVTHLNNIEGTLVEIPMQFLSDGSGNVDETATLERIRLSAEALVPNAQASLAYIKDMLEVRKSGKKTKVSKPSGNTPYGASNKLRVGTIAPRPEPVAQTFAKLPAPEDDKKIKVPKKLGKKPAKVSKKDEGKRRLKSRKG